MQNNRQKYFDDIVKRDPSQMKWHEGWTYRL